MSDLSEPNQPNGPIGHAIPGEVQGQQDPAPQEGHDDQRPDEPASGGNPSLLTDGPIFEEFCKVFIKQSIGQFSGQPLRLEPFQRDFINDVLSRDAVTGKRRYSEAMLLLPRKSGKSTLAAALAIFQTLRDAGKEPQTIVAATSKDQAAVIFRQIRAFIANNPELSALLIPKQYHIDVQGGGFIKVVASDGRLQHGSNPSCVIVDELWAHQDGELYTALTSGSGARDEPLTIAISTPGYDPDQILGQIYNRVIETAPDQQFQSGPYYRRIARDPDNGFLLYHYGAPEDADADSPEVWRKSNPAPWITDQYLRQQRFKPTTRLSEFRRLHLGQWVHAGEESWLPMGSWQACAEEGVTLDPALPVAVGIDVGITRDASAVVIAQKQGDNIVVESRVWANPYPKDSSMGAAWQVDIEEIRRYLVTLKDRFPTPMVKIDGRTRPGPAFCYDPWSFRESAQMLEGENLAMVETNQTDSRMVPMTADLFQSIVTRRLRYDPKTNVALTRHVMAAVAVPRGDAGWRIRKPRGSTTAKVDAAIAMVMAVSQAMQPAPKRAFTGMIA